MADASPEASNRAASCAISRNSTGALPDKPISAASGIL
jgi:hypothetical protein